MSRKFLYAILVIIALVVSVSVFVHSYYRRSKAIPETRPLLPRASFPVKNEPPMSNTNLPASHESQLDWEWTNRVPLEQRDEAILRAKKMLAIVSAANVPIVFYGRFLDQFSNPVSHVKVTAKVNGLSMESLAKNSTLTTGSNVIYSDSQGYFTIKDLHGGAMDLQFDADGYELATHSPTTFAYGPGYSVHHTAVQTNPVVYHLWKRGDAAQLFSFYNEGMIPSDGQSIWVSESLEHWSRDELTNAIFKLTVNRERRVPSYEDRSPYNWSFQLTSLGGQIQKTDDLFLYKAPESGYYSSISVTHSADESGWLKEQKIQFYFRTKSNKYGQGSLKLLNREEKSEVYCELGLAWNPDGGRNLESKPQ